MAFKFLTFAAVVAVARAGLIAQPAYESSHGYASHGYAGQAYAAPAYAAPIAKYAPVAYAAPVAKYAVDDFDANPQYKYAYDIQDGLTGDSKSQHESREGDVVHGSYSLIDADGYKRTVDYTADDHNGFNAVVRREPLGHAAPVVKYAAPVAYAAPVTKYTSSPVAYAAPVAKYASYAAPQSYYH